MAQSAKSPNGRNGHHRGAITWTNARRKLSDLSDWKENPATISEKQAARLEASLAEFGQISTLAIDADGKTLVDGHQRAHVWALSQKFGPDYKVDVRIASRKLKRAERQRLAILLRSGAVGEYDWDIIGTWDSQLLKDAGMNAEMLRALNREQAALIDLLESEEKLGEEKLEEEIERLKSKSMLRVLISIPIDSTLDAKKLIAPLEKIPEVEIIYGAN